MKILVACEESQVVTAAFRNKGHEAFSCDLEPTSGKHPEWHLEQDVEPLLIERWDMIIAFPPCTHLASSGAKHFKAKVADGRQQAGIDFFMLFTNLTCPKIAIENPVGIMSTRYRKPDQIINPYQFGHQATKKTCLWLKELPLLRATDVVYSGDDIEFGSGKRMNRWQYDMSCVNPKERAKKRSVTFPGIAEAMAEQWG